MPNILAFAHDAGGAELIAAIIKAELHKHNWRIITKKDCPANTIFNNHGLSGLCHLYNREKISELLDNNNADLVLFNPGWNDFPLSQVTENDFLKIPLIAILDHWIDYRERFKYPDNSWHTKLPDYIAVCDSEAYRLAIDLHLPNVVKLKNYNIISLRESFQNLLHSSNFRTSELLYISQTIIIDRNAEEESTRFTYFGYLEQRALQVLLDNFDFMHENWDIQKIKIRLHPAENKFRHESLFKNIPTFPISIEHSNQCELLESLAKAKIVAGLNSMALFNSYICNKPTISLLPFMGEQVTIPLPDKCLIDSVAKLRAINYQDLVSSKCDIDFYEKYDLDNLLKDINL